MRAFGASDQQIAAATAGLKAADVEILPSCLPAVRLFLALGTQWRVGGMAGAPLGLDYAAVEPAARMTGVTMTPELFEDLQVLEGAALAAFAERLAPGAGGTSYEVPGASAGREARRGNA